MHHQHAVVTLKTQFRSQHPLGCLETGTAYGGFGWAGDGVVGCGMQPCPGPQDPWSVLLWSTAN